MKRLLIILSAIFSFAGMQAQTTDGYLTDGDIVSIRYSYPGWNINNMYLQLSQQGIGSIGYPDENCLWRLGIVENGNSYQYTFEHVATGLYLRTQITSQLQTADIVTGNASNRTAFRFDCTERVKDSYLRGHLGCVIVIPSWGNAQVFACLTSTNGVLQFCPWEQFDVYIEKWTQSGSGNGTMTGYFSPEVQKFGLANDNDAAREQAVNAKFVFPTHIHSFYQCVNRPELTLGGGEAEVTEFPTPTFYWKSQGENGSNISVLKPADYHVPTGAPDIEGRDMLKFSDVAQDNTNQNIWNFTITPLNESPKNLQHKDKYGTYRWVNYMDTLVAEYTYDGKNDTIEMLVERNSYHEEELPSLVISVNPGSYTFAKEAEEVDITVNAVHQHGTVLYDVEGNAVETVYDEGFSPTKISSIHGEGWTTELKIEYPEGTREWLTATVVPPYTIRVTADANTTGSKRSAMLTGELYEGENRHGHSGTFAIQLHQRGKEGGIQFITQPGFGASDSLKNIWGDRKDPQPVHTAERTIYYTQNQQIELKLAESGFSGYMRWYDYETGGNPHYNDRHNDALNSYPSTDWHTQPRGANGSWFVNINTPRKGNTPDEMNNIIANEGYSMGLYALNNSAKDKAGRQLTAAMGAILDETYKTNDRLTNPSPILYGWDYTYNANATTDDEKRLSGYHTMACDVSAYTDYEITTQEGNTSRITHIKEPTLSYRQLFHLKPADEIADKFAALADGKYLEEYHYMAPVGPDVYLSTEFRHAAKQPETEKCYFYWKNGELTRVNGDARWYDERGSDITPGTYNAKDYLDVDAQSPGTKTYYLRVPNAFGSGKHLNIAKFTVEFVHANACGPSPALISMEQIRAQYKVLEYIDFSFGAPAPGTDNERALSKPLPWTYATYGFVYPSDITGDGENDYVRGDSQGEFPYFGEYRLVNKVAKDFGGPGVYGDNHGGAANGYAMYVDGTMEPGMVASISTNAVICSAQTMYCSMWLRNPSTTNHEGALPIFRCNIQGRKKTVDGQGKVTFTQWEDAGVFFVGSINKNSGWQQIVFPVNSANNYDETRVSLYNFATDNMANDFMIDDICLFVSQLPFAAYQGKMACRTTADEKTHAVAVLRLDYSNIDKDNDGYMYYQIYNENLKEAINLSGEAAYYHEAHTGEDHTAETYYGSIEIPEQNYKPTTYYQSVTKFVDDLMASGQKNGKAYVRIVNDGVEKYLLYVGHIIENTPDINKANSLLYSGHEYTLRMAHTPNELDKAECNMRTPLHATQATFFQLDSDESNWDKIHSTSYNHCANQLYFLTSKIENTLALNVGGSLETPQAPIQSDWLVIYDTWEHINVYAEAVPTEANKLAEYNARLAVADTIFKQKYSYTRGQIANAILHDMRRIPTADDPNPNYKARSFKELDPNYFQTHANYNIIKHLCDNDWLEMHKTTTFFYLGAQDTARYLVYPIEGTAKAKLQGHNDSIVLKDCKEERYVAISSMNWDYHLNATPVPHDEKTKQQRMQLPTVKVIHDNINNVKLPITDLFSTNNGGIKINNTTYTEGTIIVDLENLPNYMKYMDMTTGKVMATPAKLEIGKEYTIRLQYNDKDNSESKRVIVEELNITDCPIGYIYFHLLVMPKTLVWQPVEASFNGWGKDENWKGWIDNNGDGVIEETELTEGYVPIEGANVVIPNLGNSLLYPYIVPDHDHNHYPMTIGFQPHHCDSIYFAPGARLNNQHLLKYEKAFVDMQFSAAKWHMVSAPLQGMVSGDMFIPHNGRWSSDDNNLIAEPNPFEVSSFKGIRHADAAYAFWEAFYESDVDGSNTLVKDFNNLKFTQSNSLKQPLEQGEGFMVYGLGHKNTDQLTVRLPKPDKKYYYYDEGEIDESNFVEIPQDNRGKLAFTATHNNQEMEITLTKQANSNYFLFGNPTMAYVDMHALYLDHSNQWKGVFMTMMNDQFTPSVQTTLTTTDRYLPPMTSALLESNDPNQTTMTITLKPTHLTIDNSVNPADNTSSSLPSRQIASSPIRPSANISDDRPINYLALESELLTIYALGKNATARIVLATNPAAEDYYQVGEDALFISTGVENQSYVTSPLNMYTVAEQVPMMADVRQGISQIPLAILAADNARQEYMQLAFYYTSNWTRTCYFCDTKTGQKIRIMDGLVIQVEMPENHEQRYSIEGPDTYQGSNGVVTSTTQPSVSNTGNKVWAYAPDRSTVVVSSTDLIKSATLYDITGRLIAQSPIANSQSPNTLMTNTLTLSTTGTAGVYIVDVTLRDGSTEQAQVIIQ